MFVSVVTFLTVGDFCHFPLLIRHSSDLNPNLGCSGTPIWEGDPKPSGWLSLPVVAVGFQQRLPLGMAPVVSATPFLLGNRDPSPQPWSQPSVGLWGTGVRSWWEAHLSAQWDQPCPLEESPTLGPKPPDQQRPKFSGQEAEPLREGSQGDGERAPPPDHLPCLRLGPRPPFIAPFPSLPSASITFPSDLPLLRLPS